MMEVPVCIKLNNTTNKETLQFYIECEYCDLNFSDENKLKNHILKFNAYTKQKKQQIIILKS